MVEQEVTLSELMVLVCERRYEDHGFDFDVVEHPTRLNACKIILNGKRFTFDGGSSPFNPVQASKTCKSKIDMHAIVSDASFPSSVQVPKTKAFYDPDLYSPQCVDEKYRMFREDAEVICSEIAEDFEFPIVVKPNSKSMSLNGSVVYDPKNIKPELSAIFCDAGNYDSDAIVQERINIKREFRTICFEGECVMAIHRDVSNARSGSILNPAFWDGVVNRVVEDDHIVQASTDIAAFLKERIGLRYTGFDIAEDHDGRVWFIEANSAPMMPIDDLLDTDDGRRALHNLTTNMFDVMAEEAGIDLQ